MCKKLDNVDMATDFVTGIQLFFKELNLYVTTFKKRELKDYDSENSDHSMLIAYLFTTFQRT